jgi:hypothetical protein
VLFKFIINKQPALKNVYFNLQKKSEKEITCVLLWFSQLLLIKSYKSCVL